MRHFFYRRIMILLPFLSLALLVLCWLVQELTKGTDFLFWLPFLLAQFVVSLACGKCIQKLKITTYKDSLTGLANRRYFMEQITREIKRTERTNSPISLAMMDLDNFKNINDKYGHLRGDEVIKEVANIILKNSRALDTVCRWGGEEFAVILPETDIEGASVFASRLRKIIEAHDFKSNVTISIGLVSTIKYIEPNKLVKLADNALYKAKAKKNEVVVSDISIAS